MTVIKRIRVDGQRYSEITLPNGAAPIHVAKALFSEEGGALREDYDIFYIDPEQTRAATVFGVYIINTNDQFPKDVRIFPEEHPLVNQVLPPNARYVATVGDSHLFLGNPREQA